MASAAAWEVEDSKAFRHAECNTSLKKRKYFHRVGTESAGRTRFANAGSVRAEIGRNGVMTNDPRWEYKTITETSPAELLKQVQRWDVAAGWELVSVVTAGEHLTAFMRRAAPRPRRPAVNPIGLHKH